MMHLFMLCKTGTFSYHFARFSEIIFLRVTELLKKLYYRSSLSTEEAIVAEKLAQEFEHNGINLEKNKLNQLYTLQDEIR